MSDEKIMRYNKSNCCTTPLPHDFIVW